MCVVTERSPGDSKEGTVSLDLNTENLFCSFSFASSILCIHSLLSGTLSFSFSFAIVVRLLSSTWLHLILLLPVGAFGFCGSVKEVAINALRHINLCTSSVGALKKVNEPGQEAWPNHSSYTIYFSRHLLSCNASNSAVL